MNRVKFGSSVMYVFENVSTLYEINVTVAIKIVLIGSNSTGKVIWVEFIVKNVHSITNLASVGLRIVAIRKNNIDSKAIK